jgi:hypothetical protein
MDIAWTIPALRICQSGCFRNVDFMILCQVVIIVTSEA